MVFDRLANRDKMERTADLHKAPFKGIWLEAVAGVLRKRVAARAAGPSDADVAVLDLQLAQDPGAITWCKLDAGQSATALVERILHQGPWWPELLVAVDPR